MNKKGCSTGFAWFYGILTIFALGLIFIVFNQVFVAQLVPTIKGMTNGTIGGMETIPLATQVEINSGIDKYMDFFHAMPFILFFVVVLYMIIAAIRKERESEFG